MAETENLKGAAASQAGDKYIVRFPAGMRERIAEAAKANNRSMNAEIVERIDRSFAAAANDEETTLLRVKAAELQGTVDGLRDAVESAKQTNESLKAGLAAQRSVIHTMGMLLEVIGEATPGGSTKGTELIRKLSEMGRAFVDDDFGKARKAFDDFMQGGTDLHNQAIEEKWPGYEKKKPIAFPLLNEGVENTGALKSEADQKPKP